MSKCNFCGRKTPGHNMLTNASYSIIFIKTDTMALLILTFDNTTKIIKFKKLYNAIVLGHLKSH